MSLDPIRTVLVFGFYRTLISKCTYCEVNCKIWTVNNLCFVYKLHLLNICVNFFYNRLWSNYEECVCYGLTVCPNLINVMLFLCFLWLTDFYVIVSLVYLYGMGLCVCAYMCVILFVLHWECSISPPLYLCACFIWIVSICLFLYVK